MPSWLFWVVDVWCSAPGGGAACTRPCQGGSSCASLRVPGLTWVASTAGGLARSRVHTLILPAPPSPDSQVVRRLTADWPATFVKLKHALVEAQVRLHADAAGALRAALRRGARRGSRPQLRLQVGAAEAAWLCFTCCAFDVQTTASANLASPADLAFPLNCRVAQMDVLQRTGWRMRLDLAADVLPCYAMLFCPTLLDEPKLKLPQRAGVALPLGPASAEHKEWAATMRHLCAVIRDKVGSTCWCCCPMCLRCSEIEVVALSINMPCDHCPPFRLMSALCTHPPVPRLPAVPPAEGARACTAGLHLDPPADPRVRGRGRAAHQAAAAARRKHHGLPHPQPLPQSGTRCCLLARQQQQA